MATCIVSKFGKNKFSSGGFTYVFDKKSANGETEFWRCERRAECKARVHVVNGEIVKTVNLHSHEASAAKVESDVIITTIKNRAKNTVELTSQVINESVYNISEACQGILPNQNALRKVVRRVRNKIHSAPVNPNSLETLEIPANYRVYDAATQEKFLLADSSTGPSRILIFGRERNLQLFKDCKTWYADGTFRIAPLLFSQVYVILGEKLGGVHPIFYALLPNKQRSTYDKMFDMILDLQQEFRPESISCDYETAAFKSMYEHFPNVQIRGCFFHLTHNMKKHLSSMGLINEYNNNAQFALQAKMISALAFIPPQDLDETIERLSEILPEDLQPLLEWFEDNYVGRMNRRGNGRRSPLFPHDMWNLYTRVLNREDRTNNHAEAAHRRLQVELGMDHPNIWKFIDGMRKIQRGRDLYYEQLVAGQNPPLKLKKYRDADARIFSIVENYANRDKIEYLRGIAHNFEMDS